MFSLLFIPHRLYILHHIKELSSRKLNKVCFRNMLTKFCVLMCCLCDSNIYSAEPESESACKSRLRYIILYHNNLFYFILALCSDTTQTALHMVSSYDMFSSLQRYYLPKPPTLPASQSALQSPDPLEERSWGDLTVRKKKKKMFKCTWATCEKYLDILGIALIHFLAKSYMWRLIPRFSFFPLNMKLQSVAG